MTPGRNLIPIVRHYGLTGLIATSSLVAVMAAGAHANGPAPERHAAKFEVRFLEMMIDHHAMAIEMATICVSKDTRAELKELCQSVITAQQNEIEMMQQWLAEWYGIDHEPQMSSRDRRQLERLTQLSDAAFEIEFMTMLIAHHWTAVTRAIRCVGRAFHDEVEELCESIITVQLAEIFQLRQWLCQWHGLCDVRIDGEIHGARD